MKPRSVTLRGFYERLGFALVGPRRFGEDDCLVYQLSCDNWTRDSGMTT